MDRRVRYTRMVLNESLLKFLEEKHITKITVKEICTDADVNRSTYYAHFTDPYDQLAQLKAELIRDVAEYASGIDTGKLSPWDHRFRVLKSVLQYVEKKKPLFQTLLGMSGDRELQEKLLTVLGEKAFAPDVAGIADEEKRHFLLTYAANGCFGMFYNWLFSKDSVSCEKLAKLMADFTNNLSVQ